MATLASNIVGDASRLLNDVANVHWPVVDLLGWLREAEVEVITARPHANALHVSHTLAAGTRQTIPADGIAFMAVTSNTNGPAVRQVDMAGLNVDNPGWRTDATNAVVDSWMIDGTDPKVFYVIPPQPVSPGAVDLTYSAVPPVPALGNNITINDEYVPALVDYIVFRALSEDTDMADPGRAMEFHNKYRARLELGPGAGL